MSARRSNEWRHAGSGATSTARTLSIRRRKGAAYWCRVWARCMGSRVWAHVYDLICLAAYDLIRPTRMTSYAGWAYGQAYGRRVWARRMGSRVWAPAYDLIRHGAYDLIQGGRMTSYVGMA